jgi:4-hydroxy-L-threonine phosphate dehydrogenase PdxA
MIKDGATETRPVIALAMGDPAGISPELTARIIALPEIREAAHLVVIGDRRILEDGAKEAGLDLNLASAPLDSFEQAGKDRHVFIDLAHLNPADVVRGEATLAG